MFTTILKLSQIILTTATRLVTSGVYRSRLVRVSRNTRFGPSYGTANIHQTVDCNVLSVKQEETGPNSSLDLELAKKELEAMREDGIDIPEIAFDEFFLTCYAGLKTRSQKKRQIEYMRRNQTFRDKNRQKKLAKKKENVRLDQQSEPMVYPNRLVRTAAHNAVREKYSRLCNLTRGILHGPKVALDFSYDDIMYIKERQAIGRQLSYACGRIATNYIPLNLHFTNLRPDSPVVKHLYHHMTEDRLHELAQLTERSHSELFARDEIVYLSPDSPNVMMRYQEDKVHVVGALVDLQPRSNHSLHKIQNQGLNSARLPLDLYLKMCAKSALTLDQVLLILQDLYNSGDWLFALKRNIPPKNVLKFKDDYHWTKNYDGPAIVPIEELKYLL